MKKLVFTFFALSCLFLQISSAQQSSDALGIRFGGSDGTSAEISYQNGLGGNNRIEADLGFIDGGNYNGFKFTLQYQWIFQIEGPFNVYVGAGGSIGAWDSKDNFPFNSDNDEGLFLDAVGQFGIEYYFTQIPFQISLDARPEIGLINDDFDFGYGFSVRYTF